MKLKPVYFIPFFGGFKYFKEYFKGESRGYKEAKQAIYMEMYHMVWGLIIFMPIVIWLFIKMPA